VKVVVSVGNIEAVTAGLISTELRKMIREIDSGHLSSEHGRICNEISTEPRLREALEGFGVVMTSFEIMKLVVDDRKKQMDEANSSVGTFGETQTTVHNSGTVIIGDRVWDAMSAKPIAPKSRVRVKRVVLEIEEDASTR
ncbi:MAG TPA: NfeD family protein, partial [Anaerolineales bacterium]